ncbi:MAG: DeoR family transcriptional regulator, partial [Acidimicrobiia bacterium]|nr:DeoR family transcriptional regulator [Acidimicrobiia bacterium]
MLDERKSVVLAILIEEYIRNGEPVSSATVLERSNLAVSSATIRNDLAALERDGFVAQPHTSAGRVPTTMGYRHYVDHVEPT